ncbi:UNVERIFIED_CONTAM: hypothetical protein ITH24_24905, partial [Salmonella enterica subsp. enterica serovar Weltevreden]
VVGRQPVYLFGEQGIQYFWGMTAVTIRLPDLLDTARVLQLPERGYDYRLWRHLPTAEQVQVISESAHPPGADAITHSL